MENLQATELRIGNLVYDTRGDVNFVTVDALRYIETYSGAVCQAKPIPLTPEWFEKCGGKNGGEKLLFISMPKNKAELHFEMKPYGNVVVLKSDFGEFVPEDVEYVHQLQNLFFALTGEELTIKEAQK